MSTASLPADPMRLLLVDDHRLFAQGLRLLLRELAPELEVDIAGTLAEALDRVRRERRDAVLLDWHLPDADGLRSLPALLDTGQVGKVVVLSGDPHPDSIRRAIAAGAAGFIPKTYGSDVMLAALQVALRGGIFLPPEVLRPAGETASEPPPAAAAAPPPAKRLVDLESRFPGLTPRQADVYRAAARGLSNKLIARALGIEESTVKTHLSAVYATLGVSSRTQAVLQASMEGFRVG